MEKVNLIIYLILSAFFTSCTSDSDNNENNKENETVEYKINFNDTPLEFASLKAVRDGDYFSIGDINDFPQPTSTSNIANGLSFYFHKDGTLLTATIYDNTLKDFLYSPFYFSKNLFKFNIENIDEVNKKIKVNFNGNLYEHYNHQIYEYNKKLNGSISLFYSDKNPLNSRKTYGTTMKINGQNWRGLGYIWTSFESEKSHILNINGDNEYSINIVFPKGTRKIGKYTFNKNSDISKDFTVNFLRYYPNSIGPESYYIGPNEFISTGTLEITEVNNQYIVGTFSLTATDPITNEKIVITDGVFKERHDLD
ncbi:DUF6252 family protein [Flavobacterium hercynium]|uniref:Uncharacterized protein n=1 Tax=Flavobacterium hercynium TaxID=387094 RepID=A0A226HEW0_9FLAO|nr:DUF6252 family protein [Flavobacterium hercynium]OXA92827.1 hypothetical protein B0A66_08615 [Flavobacterium hercynium]SMP02464.1 hypothetical protein SAMN06265346_101154 [Flavobacterium hercynium]